jgi:hypothetical protein
LLAPVLWIHLDTWKTGSTQLIDCVLAFLVFAGFVCLLPSLTYSLFSPAHDAVALGLGAVATALLCRSKTSTGLAGPLLSAVLATLAIWAKQTMIPLLVALPLYTLIRDGVPSCRRYIGFLAVFGIAVSLLCFFVFDHEGLILNMFEVPLWHIRDKSVWDAIWSFQFEFPVVTSLLIFGLLGCSWWKTFDPVPESQSNSPHRWLAFVLLGILEVPAGIAAYTKMGGSVNSFSFPIYYLAIGATLLVSKIGKSAGKDERLSFHRRVAQAALLSYSSILIFAPILQIKAHESATYADPLQAAFAFEKNHPGEAYFPWNSLSVMMAGGRLYHTEDGIISLAMAGKDLSVEQFRAHLPPHATLLALPPNYPAYWTNRRINRVLPEFSRQITVDELPGWQVYEREVSSDHSTGFVE